MEYTKNYNIYKLFFLIPLLFSTTFGQDFNDLYQTFRMKVIDPLETSYQGLSPKGKFATGAVVGFTSSRMFVRTATKMIKFAGISYIGSEVLNKAGLLKFDDLSNENKEMIQLTTQKIKRTVNEYRIQMKRHVNPKKIKEYVDYAMSKDKMSSTGFATGATFGLLV